MREDGRQPRQGLCDLPLAAFGMVPFLTSILNTMLPMLGAAKHDATREVLCYGEQGPPGHAASVPSPVPSADVTGPPGCRREGGCSCVTAASASVARGCPSPVSVSSCGASVLLHEGPP